MCLKVLDLGVVGVALLDVVDFVRAVKTTEDTCVDGFIASDVDLQKVVGPGNRLGGVVDDIKRVVALPSLSLNPILVIRCNLARDIIGRLGVYSLVWSVTSP